jgi:hypothetical protein
MVVVDHDHLWVEEGAFPDATVEAAWKHQVVEVLFYHRSAVLEVQKVRGLCHRTLGRCGSRYRHSVALEGSTHQVPYQQCRLLELVANLISFPGLCA